MQIPSRLLALASAALLLTACGGSDSNAPDNSHVGQYALQSVDGETLPIIIYEDATTLVTLTEGSMTLNANGTFLQSAKSTLVQNGVPRGPGFETCSGTYRKNGNSVTFTSPGSVECAAGTITGTLNANVLTINDEGSVMVFKR